MQKLHNEPHPIEVLLLLAWLALEAAWTLACALVVPVLALALTAARWRPAEATITRSGEQPIPQLSEPEPPDRVMTPAPAALQAQTVAQLRRLARAAGLPRTLSRTGRRADLLQALSGQEVAACS